MGWGALIPAVAAEYEHCSVDCMSIDVYKRHRRRGCRGVVCEATDMLFQPY